MIHGCAHLKLNTILILLGSVIVHRETKLQGLHIEYLVISKNYQFYNYWNMKFGEPVENQWGNLYCTVQLIFLRNMQKISMYALGT